MCIFVIENVIFGYSKRCCVQGRDLPGVKNKKACDQAMVLNMLIYAILNQQSIRKKLREFEPLTYLSRMDFPTIINWTSPFSV